MTRGRRCLGVAALRLAAAFALSGCATLPPAETIFHAATPAPRTAEARRDYNRRVYDDAWEWVGRRYYDRTMNGVDWPAARARHLEAALAAEDDDRLYEAVNAMLGELRDGHTQARSPEAVKEQRRKDGVLVGVRTGPVEGSDVWRLIVDVIPESPAAEAGVSPGWILLSCDGRRPDDVLGLGKLAEGQVIHCEFLDGNETKRTVDLTARRLSLQPVRETRELHDGLVYLRFDSFDRDAARWVRQELHRHAGAPGAIFDLRRNHGGAWNALASILGDVFPEPVEIGRTIDRKGGDRSHRLSPSIFNAGYSGRLAVLVSENSASAAEIFAHVVQYHGRGTIVGTRTAGVVLASVEWRLPGGGQLQLSLFDYRGVDGRRLERQGVAPDIAVAPAAGGRTFASDRDVQAAVAALQKAMAETEPPPPAAAKDRPLHSR